MKKITEYVRKSHSFTKEALDDLGILSRYMGDIGESAVLRYLIANEIRKVSNPHIMDKSKEEELAKLRKVMLINHLIGKSFGGHEKAEAEIKGLDHDAISHALWGDEE